MEIGFMIEESIIVLLPTFTDNNRAICTFKILVRAPPMAVP